ncbi:MAG: RrF2 family transcriptional regulator [Coprobacillaceae bacterium]
MSYSGATFQAVSILLYIHYKSEEELFDYLSSKKIAEMLNIPVPTVVKILTKLSSAKLIFTKEGAKGGNMLARPITEISLLDVFNAMEQGKPLFKTHHNFNMEYDDDLNQIIDSGVASLNSAEIAMKDSLEKVRLIDLLK